MNKLKFHPINEWKIMKGKKLKTFTPLHTHIAYCTCGCNECSIFFVFLGFGFFVTINPTPIPQVKIEEPDIKHEIQKNEKGA
jgi:hypothetical protein